MKAVTVALSPSLMIEWLYDCTWTGHCDMNKYHNFIPRPLMSGTKLSSKSYTARNNLCQDISPYIQLNNHSSCACSSKGPPVIL